jgi:hypothetical protein
VTVFYYEAKKKVWKQVDGPIEVDAGGGKFFVTDFDPDSAEHKVFKDLALYYLPIH